MRWLVLALFLPLAGCLASPEEATEVGPLPVDVPPAWQAGEWWRYEVDGTTEVDLVWEGAMLRISDREVGRQLALARIPLLGHTFHNATWDGAFFETDGFAVKETALKFAWMRWPASTEEPVEAGAGRRFGDADAVAGSLVFTGHNATTAELAYSGPVTGTATYDARVGWLSRMDLEGAGTWRLIEHGHDFDGQAWRIEQTNTDETVVGIGATYGVDSNGGNVLVSRYRLSCDLPGVTDLRIGSQRPGVGDYMSYQDVCPLQETRHDVVEGLLASSIAVEFESTALDAGSLRLDVILEEDG